MSYQNASFQNALFSCPKAKKMKICLEVIVAIGDYSQFNYICFHFDKRSSLLIDNFMKFASSDAMLGYIFINFSLLIAAALQILHISINTGFQVIFLCDIHICMLDSFFSA